jgi:AraC family transcriptional regulator of adaptative response/methylated-DNA-[protein]-cysteine methyltransferase
LRCKPLTQLTTRDPVTADLLRKLNHNPEQKWSEDDLIALGHDPSTIRRSFKRNFGMTFLDLARLHRTSIGLESLAAGAPVIEAQLDSGYASASGFREAVTRLIGETPATLKGRDLLKAAWLDTPIGQMLAIADAHRLHLLEFFDRKALPAELFSLRTRNRSAISFGRTPAIESVEREIASYFQGTLQTFTTPLALEHTAFTRKIWDELINIPYGTTTSYGALAASIGQPTAARAAARANGANQLAIIIPCHRVIGTDGTLTGYSGKLWRKQWLLEHEAKQNR